MLKRDYLVKQFEEFGNVIAKLIKLKREGKFFELNALIDDSLIKYTSIEIKFVKSLNNNELISTLTNEKKLSDEQLKILADLLYEKGEFYAKFLEQQSESINYYKKSYLIYRFIKDNATLNYSLDLHYKLEILSNMIL